MRFRAILVAAAAVAAASCADDGDAAPRETGPSGVDTRGVETPTTLPATSDAAAPSATPPATVVVDGRTCITVDRRERCWIEHRPASLVGPAPLVIDLHGWTDTAEEQRAMSGFERLADDEGFTVVWPQGLVQSWNAGRLCCDPAAFNDFDDVGFLRTLVGLLVTTDEHIDPTRVYVTGLSNGCAMTQRFALEAADIVAAGACMSHYLLNRYGDGRIAAPLMELHGTADDVVLYDRDPFFGTGARQNFDRLASIDHCTGAPEVTEQTAQVTIETHTSCADGAQVALVTVAGGGHHLYLGDQSEVDTTRIAWEFMRRFSLPHR